MLIGKPLPQHHPRLRTSAGTRSHSYAAIPVARYTLQQMGIMPPDPTPTSPIPTIQPLAFAPEQPGETLIVVAPFYHPQGVPDDQEAKLIKAAIEDQIKELGIRNLRVGVDNGAPIEADDRTGAQALGERYQASMVIWGSNTRVQITVNYLNLRQPDFAAAQAQFQETGSLGRTQLANPSAYTGFITTDLPNNMAFLSLFAVGQSAYINADYPRATMIISSAVDLTSQITPPPPGAVDAYFRLGWLYQQAPVQNNERARIAYDQAIALDPTIAKAYNNRGVARTDNGDSDGAIADLTQAIALDPKDANTYNNRGLARVDNGDLDEAIEDFTQAIALDPTFAAAYNNRGNVR